jgi:6-pyruvoyltetrahydropterin/6-carboxytetrahydropterin synthase
MWTVTKQFYFPAAHQLDHLPETHKCHRLHGHNYGVTVCCRGDLQPAFSWVVDYADIAAAVEPAIQKLDHTNLNETLGGIPYTTAENVAYWFYRELMAKLPTLYSVHIQETPQTNVIYCPRP